MFKLYVLSVFMFYVCLNISGSIIKYQLKKENRTMPKEPLVKRISSFFKMFVWSILPFFNLVMIFIMFWKFDYLYDEMKAESVEIVGNPNNNHEEKQDPSDKTVNEVYQK